MAALADVLDRMTAEGELAVSLSDGDVRCLACGHRCLIHEGRRGICKVRFNEGGRLRVPWGYVASLQCDPIEKKPFHHFLPGSDALTFGMLGCDFHCDYCQNWVTSQALRDPASEAAGARPRPIEPEEIIAYARRMGARVVVSSYNEPLITSEWAVEIFRRAHTAGMKTAFVSNGNATPEALDYLSPHLDAYKVDLKTMQDRNYRRLGGVLKNVLDTIENAHARGLWVEVVTLVVPGFNDSTDELMEAARFLASVSKDIPWHVTAFHRDYHRTDAQDTAAESLIRAAEIGQEAGLRYVYAGNRPGQVGEYESTRCPGCGERLVERLAYLILGYHLTSDGRCPSCGERIAGYWPDDPERVPRHVAGDLFSRRPRPIADY